MSEKSNLPEQLMLPFSSEDAPLSSARIFFMQDHRQRVENACAKDSLMPKEKEKKILDRVLERAERLSWYK